MDRSLKLKKQAHELLVHSDDFEIFATKGQNAIDALSSLGGLDQLTQDSFAAFRPEAPQPAETTPLAPTAPIAQKVVPTTAPHFGSSRTEYKSALKDPCLVDALLAFHQGAVVRTVPMAAQGAAQTPVRKQPSAPREHQGFAHASIPEVEASPKRDTHFRKSNGNATKVLRSW